MRRWIATHFAEEVARERVTVPRGPVDAGSEAQIDYGRLGMWFDPATARRVAVWAFVMVLAFSRHLFVRPVIRMDQTAWCACHVAAFEFFDGVPARLVCDNLRTGVDKPDLYDPQINRSYAELASHYATLVDPARARKPKDKPRVERPMTYVRDSFWKGREFDSLAQMQQAAVTWSTEVAGLRYLRALEGAQPLRMFEAVEQQALIALPPRAFELTSWSIGTVGVDTHLKVGKALYSVPWRLIGNACTRAPPVMWCRSSPATMWWPPMCADPAGAPPTSPTTHRRRSPSTCAPRPGVDTPPNWSAQPASK